MANPQGAVQLDPDPPLEGTPPPAVADTHLPTGTPADTTDVDDPELTAFIEAWERGDAGPRPVDESLTPPMVVDNPDGTVTPYTPPATQTPASDADPISRVAAAEQARAEQTAETGPDDARILAQMEAERRAGPASQSATESGQGGVGGGPDTPPPAASFTPEQLAETRAWIESLSPQQARLINDVLSSDVVTMSRQEYEQLTSQAYRGVTPGSTQPPAAVPPYPPTYPPQQAPGQGAPWGAPGVTSLPPGAPMGYGPASPLPQFTPEQWAEFQQDNPTMAAFMAQQQAQLAQMQAQQQQLAASQYEAQRHAAEEAARLARESFAQANSLNPIEVDALMRETIARQTIPHYHRQFPDAQQAIRAALEDTFYASPTFRTKALNLAMEQQRQQDAEIAARAARASSVGTAPGNAAPRTPPTPRPMNEQERVNAMAAEISAAWDQGEG